MSTIAQISATFIAITAGFYTSKIISIANEKSRISGRIREINTELSATRVNQENLQTQIDSINDADAADNIKKFKNDLLTDELLRSYKIKIFDDLISVFEKFYERKPMPIEEKYLKAQSTEIIQEVMVEQKKQNDSPSRVFRGMYAPRGEERIVKELRNQNEIDRFNNLVDRQDFVKSRLSVLNELLKVMKQELNAATYPRHIRFGFISFVVFAILGVIIPLTYGNWMQISETLEIWKLYLPIDINLAILILFGIGLTLNFVYIGLELRTAIS